MSSNNLITANFGEDTLSIVNTMRPQHVEILDLKELLSKNHKGTINKIGPTNLLYNEDKKILVLNSINDSLIELDLEEKYLTNMVKLGRCPIDMKVHLDKIYIINCDSNSISIIDRKNLRILETIQVEDRPISIDIEKSSNKIYIANLGSKSISIIHEKNYKNHIKYSLLPLQIKIFEKYIYLLSLKDTIRNYSKLVALDKKSLNIVWEIKLKGLFFDFVKIDKYEKYYLVNAEDSYLYNINIHDKKVNKILYLGGLPFKIIFDGTNYLYISDILKSQVFKVNLINNQIEDIIKVGKDPQGILLL